MSQDPKSDFSEQAVSRGEASGGGASVGGASIGKQQVQGQGYLNDRLNAYIDADHWAKSPVLLFHLVITIGLLMVAESSGQMTKVLMAPYVAYLVFSRRIEYVPALIVLLSGTTILSFVVLLSTMGVFFTEWRWLMQSVLRPLVWLALTLTAICLPIFLAWTVQDGANISALILNLDKFQFFFAMFPLFYGFLLLVPGGGGFGIPGHTSIRSLPLHTTFGNQFSSVFTPGSPWYPARTGFSRCSRLSVWHTTHYFWY